MSAQLDTAPGEDGFLAWWFAPWRQAGDAAVPENILAERDRYQDWCAGAGLPAQVPPGADPAWRAVVTGDGSALRDTARLFGGLMAARAHDRAVLQALDAGQRQWCASVAAVQPLAVCVPSEGGASAVPALADPAAVHGLAQLACHLERDHPGLWPRLRRCLGAELAGDADAMAATLVPPALAEPARNRLLRCWQLCRQASTTGVFSTPAVAPAL